jgi:hypothetical protein
MKGKKKKRIGLPAFKKAVSHPSWPPSSITSSRLPPLTVLT